LIVAHDTRPATTAVLNRFDLMKRLVAAAGSDDAIIAGIGFSNFDLWATGPRSQNFYMLGSMGLAFPIALGVALAQPQRRVVAVEGDGSILMQLGALGTIASVNPPNLTLIALDNGAYQITGGQPTTTANVTDLVAIARGSGLGNSHWVADAADFETQFAAARKADAPWFLAARIDNQRAVSTTHRDPVQIRERFMRGIGVRAEPVHTVNE
jgi:thiamine pyrophosphate-dependent acetolactate synthase large subunit-like protein